jgi:hypothetical protein
MPINFVHLQSTRPPVAWSQNLTVLARSLCYNPSNSCLYPSLFTASHFILLCFRSSTVSSASGPTHMYVGFHIYFLLFLSDINQIWIFSKEFRESSLQNISRRSNHCRSSWSMWAGGRAAGRTDIRDDSNGSFLHIFHESAKILENFKDMNWDTDICGRTALD